MISPESLPKIIMRWVVKIFFLILGVKTLHLTNFTDFENQDETGNSFRTALNKSPEELTFDRVWDAYNGLRHRLNSALARGHYTSQGSHQENPTPCFIRGLNGPYTKQLSSLSIPCSTTKIAEIRGWFYFWLLTQTTKYKACITSG